MMEIKATLSGLPIDDDAFLRAEMAARAFFKADQTFEMLTGIISNAIMQERIDCRNKVAPIPLSVHATDHEKEAYDLRTVLADKIWKRP